MTEKETQHHYQKNPFDWGQKAIENKYLKYSGAGKFINKYLKKGNNEKVLDCGCGIGMISNKLLNRGYDVTSVDLSKTSKRIGKQLYNIDVIQASNMKLPFKDNLFDYVISSGVVHHTLSAKKSVEELIRVLKPQGILYLLIYRKPSIHYLERITTGVLIRKLYKNKIGKYIVDPILVLLTIPIIYIARCIKFKTFKNVKFKHYRNYFYDRFITPKASFHNKKEIESWFNEYGMRIINYHKGTLGYHHNFICQKK